MIISLLILFSFFSFMVPFGSSLPVSFSAHVSMSYYTWECRWRSRESFFSHRHDRIELNWNRCRPVHSCERVHSMTTVHVAATELNVTEQKMIVSSVEFSSLLALWCERALRRCRAANTMQSAGAYPRRYKGIYTPAPGKKHYWTLQLMQNTLLI